MDKIEFNVITINHVEYVKNIYVFLFIKANSALNYKQSHRPCNAETMVKDNFVEIMLN